MIEEVGLEPSEDLRDLEAAIVRDDPALRPAGAAGPQLPEGEITLLLTDVVASTRLWERAPAAMAQALARHDQLIETAIGNGGGVLLKPRAAKAIPRSPSSTTRFGPRKPPWSSNERSPGRRGPPMRPWRCASRCTPAGPSCAAAHRAAGRSLHVEALLALVHQHPVRSRP